MLHEATINFKQIFAISFFLEPRNDFVHFNCVLNKGMYNEKRMSLSKGWLIFFSKCDFFYRFHGHCNLIGFVSTAWLSET